MQITTSPVNNIANVGQLNDAIQSPSYKYFTLDNNALDGTFHPYTAGEQVGYIGTQLSAVDGTFRNLCNTNINYWEAGQYDYSTGLPTTRAGALRLKQRIAVQPSTTYYVDPFTSSFILVVRQYDSSDNYIYAGTIKSTFTSDAAAAYIRVFLLTQPEGVYTYEQYTAAFSSKTVRPFICLNSVADKSFAETETIHYDFQGNASTQELIVAGDSLCNIFPKAFTVTYHTAAGDTTIAVTDNTDPIWRYVLSKVEDITSLDVTVTQLNVANKTNRLIDIQADRGLIQVSDGLKPTLATDKAIKNNLVRVEPLKYTLQETVEQHNYLTCLDSVSPAIFYANNVTNRLVSSDTLKEKMDQTKYIQVNLCRTECLNLNGRIELQEEFLFKKAERFPIVLQEQVNLTNVYTIMRQPTRQVFAKAKITFSDPLIDPVVDITANTSNRISVLSQLSDGVATEAYKWLGLTINKLDGTYHPIDSESYSIGWWSANRSLADGTFTDPPVLTIALDPRPIYTFSISGDDVTNNYPVAFILQFYDNAGTLVHTEEVTNNSNCHWNKTLPVLQNVTTITLTITKISIGEDVARLSEIFSVVQAEFQGSDLCSVHLLEETQPDVGAVKLGNISANEIDLGISNAKHMFDSWNQQAKYAGALQHNRRVELFFGVKIGNKTEWYPQGVFWTTNWNVPDNVLEVYVTARDRLELLRQSEFAASLVYENYTLYQLFQVVLVDAGVPEDAYIIDPALQQITIPFAWFSKMSHRDALKQIAGCALLNIYCDKLGRINIALVHTSPTKVTTFDDHTNIFARSYPLRWSEIANYIEVASSTYNWGESQTVLQSTTPLILAAEQELTIDYPFSNVPCKDVTVVVTADTGIIYTITLFAWGCTIAFQNTTEQEATVSAITGTGTPLKQNGTSTVVVKDEALIRSNGLIKSTVSHPFIQTTAYALSIAQQLLAAYKQSMQDVQLDSRGDIAVRLQDQVAVVDRTGKEVPYTVYRQTLDWTGALSAEVIAKQL